MTATHIATLPEYYPLYALYVDYTINNVAHARLEDMEQVRKALRIIAPLLGLEQPYRKSWALRLFTERQALASFPPELVDEAWRQVREWIERWGPPPDGPTPRQKLRRRVTKPKRSAPAQPKPPPRAEDFFPKSPVDYKQKV